jgi:hypothetical protein
VAFPPPDPKQQTAGPDSASIADFRPSNPATPRGMPGGSPKGATTGATTAATASPSGLVAPDASLNRAKIEGTFEIAGRHVPLPAGSFEVLSTMQARIGRSDAQHVLLGQIEDKQISVLIWLYATPADAKLGTGFRADDYCKRSDVQFKNALANEEFGRQDCMVVNHIWPDGFRANDAANILRSATTELDTRGVALPNALILAYYNFADMNGSMRVRYYFNPERQGIESRRTATWQDSDWHMRYVARDPKKIAYLDEMRQWASAWRPYMRKTFGGDPPELPPSDLAGRLTMR